MLYVQCANCRAIGPLVCSGSLFPHVPIPMMVAPYGAGCPGCGSVMNTFTCTTCWMGQYLRMPGRPVPAAGSGFGGGFGGGGSPVYAPVVQAQQGASGSLLRSLFKDAVKVAVHEASEVAAHQMFGQQS